MSRYRLLATVRRVGDSDDRGKERRIRLKVGRGSSKVQEVLARKDARERLSQLRTDLEQEGLDISIVKLQVKGEGSGWIPVCTIV